MKKNIIVDSSLKLIKISKDFSKKAENAESPEYRLFQTIKSEHPDYTVSLGVIKKKENKESYKGLTYEYMERYITHIGTQKELDEYKNLLFLSECHSIRYPTIKEWFLKKFPEVMKYGVKEELITNPQCAA